MALDITQHGVLYFGLKKIERTKFNSGMKISVDIGELKNYYLYYPKKTRHVIRVVIRPVRFFI